MFFNKKVLKNGLRIITVPTDNTQAVTILIMNSIGSKNETKDINGISHFLEHMLFKGTKKRSSALKISEPIDEIGGFYNAFTGEEYTGYYIKVDSDYLDLAIDWISDIYLNSQITEKEINKERGVILEEINMYLDDPMSYKYNLWNRLLYKDQPAGRDILGEKKNIQKFNRKDFLRYYQNYNSKNTVICVSGNLEKEIEFKIIKAFEKIPVGERAARRKKTVEIQTKPEQLIFKKKTDQTHLVLGVRAYNLFDEERATQKIIANILGGGMSSRLFLKIREEKGMAYYINSISDPNSDVGSLYTVAGISYKNIDEVVKIILNEYSDLKSNKISQKELQKTKDCIKGRMSLSLETSDSIANFYTSQEIFNNKIKSIQEIKDEIDRVTIDDVYNVSNTIFTNERLNLVVISEKDKEIKDFRL